MRRSWRFLFLFVNCQLFFVNCPASAETVRVVPTTFYNTYSAAHPPAAHVKPGDRVVTKTIDAAGVDWNGKTVGVGPNPHVRRKKKVSEA